MIFKPCMPGIIQATLVVPENLQGNIQGTLWCQGLNQDQVHSVHIPSLYTICPFPKVPS